VSPCLRHASLTIHRSPSRNLPRLIPARRRNRVGAYYYPQKLRRVRRVTVVTRGASRDISFAMRYLCADETFGIPSISRRVRIGNKTAVDRDRFFLEIPPREISSLLKEDRESRICAEAMPKKSRFLSLSLSLSLGTRRMRYRSAAYRGLLVSLAQNRRYRLIDSTKVNYGKSREINRRRVPLLLHANAQVLEAIGANACARARFKDRYQRTRVIAKGRIHCTLAQLAFVYVIAITRHNNLEFLHLRFYYRR